jgi:hypothetical protein
VPKRKKFFIAFEVPRVRYELQVRAETLEEALNIGLKMRHSEIIMNGTAQDWGTPDLDSVFSL